jgi:hypothetical protein
MKANYRKLPEVVLELPVGIPQMSAKCIERTDKKAMYYRWDNVWEVFRIKIAEASTVFEKSYPKREVYPGTEDFGSTAWCFSDEHNARIMYNNL